MMVKWVNSVKNDEELENQTELLDDDDHVWENQTEFCQCRRTVYSDGKTGYLSPFRRTTKGLTCHVQHSLHAIAA